MRPAVLLLTLFFVGCATPSTQTKKAFLVAHPNTAPEIQQAILESRVIVGMTKEEVRASWGTPIEISGGRGGEREYWYYNGTRCYNPPTLNFRNAVLESVDVNYNTALLGCPKEPFEIKRSRWDNVEWQAIQGT